MNADRLPLAEAVRDYDRGEAADALRRAEQQRRAIHDRFPLESWPDMPLTDYALGQEDSEDTFCRWMEFRSMDLGSMRGGSARKLIIYKHKDKPGWYFPKHFADEAEAWETLRGEFVAAFGSASRGEWAEIDTLPTLALGPALRLKTLHVYFPDQVFPVYSAEHIRHYLKLLTGKDDGFSRDAVGQANHRLLGVLRDHPALVGWSPIEIAHFLYWWGDPRKTSRVVKISPGDEAKYWDACLRGGYVCVGWDEVGDLTLYDSKDAFREAFGRAYPYKGHLATVTKKSKELWTLRDLEPGDLVVANKGTSEILAVGEVVEPGYRWNAEREDYRHTVTVTWDTSYATRIPPQKRWGLVTVAKVPDALFKLITSGQRAARPAPQPSRVDPLYRRIATALERKGQLILYGPPGTGKTYAARRFATWWLAQLAGEKNADTLLVDTEAAEAREAAFARAEGAHPAALTRITFHPSYAYEDFIEGFRPRSAPDGSLTLQLEDGIFKRVCRTAESNPERTFLILVDEINRGNVAKILGELLTLLEQDKRGLTITLPQSKQPFSIPPNVFVLGTMNTADRSIKLLDAALRRRFAFIELMPDLELLRGSTVGELPLDDFLEELNRRIAASEGREKQIGHAYLLDGSEAVSDPEEFAARFREEILPLLQEYCYDEYPALARFIGSGLVDAQAQSLDHDKLTDPEQLLAELVSEFTSPTAVGEE